MRKLYGVPGTRSSRVSWALAELELDYEFVPVRLREGEGRSPAFLQLNPAGKVPVLVDGDVTLAESQAILTYLGDRYGSGQAIPAAGSAQRARHDMLACFVLSELEQPLWLAARHRFVYPESHRVPAILPSCAAEWQRASTALAALLDPLPDYALGAQFTMVDILIAHTLQWAKQAENPLPDTLEAYRARCYARPAATRHQAAEQARMDQARAQAAAAEA